MNSIQTYETVNLPHKVCTGTANKDMDDKQRIVYPYKSKYKIR